MLDKFVIFNRGGVILFQHDDPLATIRGSPVNALILNVLLNDRNKDQSYIYDSYALKWTLANDVDLIFVALYQRILHLSYVDELLQVTKELFLTKYKNISNHNKSYDDFTKYFLDLCTSIELKHKKDKPDFKIQSTVTISTPSDVSRDQSPKDDSTTPTTSTSTPSPSKRSTQMRQFSKKKSDDKDNNKEKDAKKKKATKWGGEVTEEDKQKFDLSIATAPTSQSATSTNQNFLTKNDSDDDVEDEEFSDIEETATESTSVTGTIFSFFKGLTTTKPLSHDDLAAVMVNFRDLLIGKNVAQDTADALCTSVTNELIGKKPGTFTRLATIVRDSLREALTRILTPSHSIDVLTGVTNAKKSGRPYSIVFVGINGVGKSTTLAKVAYWLQQNGKKVMISACDTFRAGAVEQLRVHANTLGIHLFELGYGKDASMVARKALEYGKENDYDVVLVDTAGRMQDNTPLMISLSKLINSNNPDLVLFIGEALVGNDAVDQVTKFNKALEDISDSAHPRLMDGIILTKFDTIDDKVGAAISMAYTTGRPIFFVGTGQRYVDLRRMNIVKVVKSLLK